MLVDNDTALTDLGFNRLESMVYCELLRRSPATGYRISQEIGRAPANIYQALKALLQKGAVLVESDAADATSYVPVPPDQLLAALRSDFAERSDAALAALRRIQRPARQETLSQLRTAAQVLEQARSMLGSARETVVFDCIPRLYDLLRADFDRARDRGVIVAGIAYRAEDAGPMMPFKGEPESAVRERWPGSGLILVTDGNQQLVALIGHDMVSVLNAVYSDGTFLSCIMHGLLQADIRLVALSGEKAVPAAPLDAIALLAARPPGLRALLGG